MFPEKSLLTLSQNIHYHGYTTIYWLQKGFGEYEDTFLTLSHLGSPRMAFLLYFPLVLYLFDASNGKKLLWSAVISEWTNMMLKWSMFGDRPYWWPHMHNVTYVHIKQFYLTCETGPGMPSGHAMVSAATWYFVVTSFTHSLQRIMTRYHCPAPCPHLLTTLAWTCYATLLACIGVSRVFIAAHFPHQLILGTAVGIAVAVCVDRLCRHVSSFSYRPYLAVTLCLLITTPALYSLLRHGLHLDPDWSVPLAYKHCAHSDYIHLITRPFSAFARDVGSILGLGLAVHTHISAAADSVTFRSRAIGCAANVCKLAISCVFVTALDYYMWTGDTELQFYVLLLMKCVLRIYVIAALIPYFVHVTFSACFTYHCDPRPGVTATDSRDHSQDRKCK